MKPIVAIFLLTGLLAACAPAPQPAAPAAMPSPPVTGVMPGPLLLVDEAHSLVTIQVARAGPLARLGHDHVLACRHLAGFVSLVPGEARLTVPLGSLSVDEPALRRAAGLDADVDEEAAAGTRRNLQVKVLDTARYPVAQVFIRREGPDELLVSMTVRGHEHRQRVKARLERLPDGGLRATGHFTVRQSDFGMTPFSVLGGALQVADAVGIRFEVVAHPGPALIP